MLMAEQKVNLCQTQSRKCQTFLTNLGQTSKKMHQIDEICRTGVWILHYLSQGKTTTTIIIIIPTNSPHVTHYFKYNTKLLQMHNAKEFFDCLITEVEKSISYDMPIHKRQWLSD